MHQVTMAHPNEHAKYSARRWGGELTA